MQEIALEIGVRHIAYSRLSSNKSSDINQLAAVATYSKLWQQRYFIKNYVAHDPVMSYGRNAEQPFDWVNLPAPDPVTIAFLADALTHGVGRNGLSIPLRDPRGTFAVVSFTSDLSRAEWDHYKVINMPKLKLLSVLIHSASHINFKLRAPPAHLSHREAQCLLWAARGRTFQEIAETLGLALGTVKTHLDAARQKLRCINLPHAAAIAFATGAIPEQALQLAVTGCELSSDYSTFRAALYMRSVASPICNSRHNEPREAEAALAVLLQTGIRLTATAGLVPQAAKGASVRTVAAP